MQDARYWVLASANTSNKINEVRDAAGMPLVAIVDDYEGGIVAYAHITAAAFIVDALNQTEGVPS